MGDPGEFDPESPEHSDVGERAADDFEGFAAFVPHYYRGEMDRVTTWRSRLDQTTNWAVIVLSAILTWSFSSENNPHYVLLVGMFTVVAFLVVEAGRFRKYDVFREHVRNLQQNLFANVYDPTGAETADWREQLGRDLRDPHLGMSLREALGHRLRRIYLFLVTAMFGAWVFRITVFEADESWQQVAEIGGIPGEAVVAVVAGFYLLLVGLALESHVRDPSRQEFDES